MKETPIGNGIGSYPLAVIDNQEIIEKICTRLDVMYDRSTIPTCVTKAPSAFGLYTTEFGYLFTDFFLITLFFKQNNNFILSTFIKGIGLFILTAFSITFPLIWIILALLSVDDDRYKKCIILKRKHSMTESERLLSEVKEHWEERFVVQEIL